MQKGGLSHHSDTAHGAQRHAGPWGDLHVAHGGRAAAAAAERPGSHARRSPRSCTSTPSRRRCWCSPALPSSWVGPPPPPHLLGLAPGFGLAPGRRPLRGQPTQAGASCIGTSISAVCALRCRQDRRASAGRGGPVWHPCRQHLPLQHGAAEAAGGRALPLLAGVWCRGDAAAGTEPKQPDSASLARPAPSRRRRPSCSS